MSDEPWESLSLVSKLREWNMGGVPCVTEAANMLEFLLGQMQMHSPKMNGQHSYRFKSGGWPMTHCVGPNAEEAVRSAILEVVRSKMETENGKS